MHTLLNTIYKRSSRYMYELLHTERIKKKKGFHAVCYIGTIPRLVQIETWFLR